MVCNYIDFIVARRIKEVLTVLWRLLLPSQTIIPRSKIIAFDIMPWREKLWNILTVFLANCFDESVQLRKTKRKQHYWKSCWIEWLIDKNLGFVSQRGRCLPSKGIKERGKIPVFSGISYEKKTWETEKSGVNSLNSIFLEFTFLPSIFSWFCSRNGESSVCLSMRLGVSSDDEGPG